MTPAIPNTGGTFSAQTEIVPVSLVIPTRNRAVVLQRMLISLAGQSAQPAEIIVVDASADRSAYEQCIARPVEGLASALRWVDAKIVGAAAQRNQGVTLCRYEIIGFCDDDIVFETECVARLYAALRADSGLGGVNAMITNQKYSTPGIVSRLMFRIMAGEARDTYAGGLLGPAINLLPEDREDLPEVVPVEWLNTTCTLYRRKALPEPVFSDFFTGYSMMEDVTLSVSVGRTWKLANVRTARIFHDSQQGDHKDDSVANARMSLTNRHYVMNQVLRRRRVRDYAKLALWEAFQLSVCAVQNRFGKQFWLMLSGKWLGLWAILGSRYADTNS